MGEPHLTAAWRRGIVAALALRVVAAVAAFAFGGLLPGLEPVSVADVPDSGFEGRRGRSAEAQGAQLLTSGLERFDALWYLAIATDGYPPRPTDPDAIPAAAAFYPAYPLLLGVIGRLLGGAYVVAANLLAVGAAAAAFAGVHRLVEVETGDQQLAGRTVAVLAVFPASFFLVAPYTEALFLAVTSWALVAARQLRWWRVAALGTVAGATRNVGVLLCLALGLAAWRAHREHRGQLLRGVAAAATPAIGAGAYLAFCHARFGAWNAPLRAQSGWERERATDLGDVWVTVVDAVRFGTDTPGEYTSGYHSVDLIIGLAIAVAVGWLLWRVPLPYGAYALAHVAVWLVYPFPGRPLMSTYRFALAIAPLPWAFAAMLRRPGVAAAWYAACGALWGVLLLLFVGWYFVF